VWWAALQMRKPSKGLCSSTAVLLAGLSANALAIPTVSTVAPSLVAEGKVVGQGSQPETSVFCNASTLPLYVINLDNRASKLRTFAERLPSPLSACRVTGVNGDALPFSLPSDLISSLEWRSAQLRTTLRLPIMGTFLTKGAVGLTLAHARAWAHMLERGDEMALIAEDDLYFYVPNAIEQIEGACETARLWSPKQILLQFCGTNTTAGYWPKPSHGQENYTDAQVMWTRTGAKLTKASLLPITTESCQGFYLLTREGARIMLNSLFPIVNQIDAGIQPLRIIPEQAGEVIFNTNISSWSRYTWSPFWGAARAPGLETHGLFPPIAQVDERTGYSDVQQGFNYVGHAPDTEGGASNIEACGGLASLGTSDNSTLLLDYFREHIGKW